jgi:hypothetical protein
MSTVVKHLTISESEAVKALNDAINAELTKKMCVKLLPTDWTIDRLMEKGLSKVQSRDVISKMIKDGVAVEIRYMRENKYVCKGCRAKE